MLIAQPLDDVDSASSRELNKGLVDSASPREEEVEVKDPQDVEDYTTYGSWFWKQALAILLHTQGLSLIACGHTWVLTGR